MRCKYCNGEKVLWIVPAHKNYPTHQAECYHCKGSGVEPTQKQGSENK